MYQIGEQYTRQDIYELLHLSEGERGGDWLNGYHRHQGDYYIFCNVGIPGRTGHDYDNHWEGEKLVWHGKTKSHFGQETIQNLCSSQYRVFIFYRSEDRAPFTFAGIGRPIPHYEIERPARIDWVFTGEEKSSLPVFTDELYDETTFREGTRLQVFVNRYERDRRARDQCLKHHGSTCQICGFSFEKAYGDLGKGFIHVHHIIPVSDIGPDYAVNPVTDLIPVCANCHAMLHRRDPPLMPEELKERL